MVSLSTQFTVGAAILVLYLVTMIVFYSPSPLTRSEAESSKGERLRLEEELLLSAAREEGMAAGRRGGGVGMAKERSDSSSKGRECQEMFTMDKGGELWVDDGPYTEVSLQLPSLLINWKSGANGASASLVTSTRLAMLNGSVPYLPCKIRQFDPNDLGSCVDSRSHQGRKTWIAFVSDSNGRFKLHTFLSFLPPGLHYTFFLGYQEVSFETFLVSVAHHRHRPLTFDIVGHRNKKGNPSEGNVPSPLPFPSPDQDVFSLFNETENPNSFNFSLFTLRESDVPPDYDLRVSLVWAPLGSEANAAMLQDRIKVTKVDEWAGLEVIPDVIIVGFGTWMLLARKEMDEVGVFAESERLARPLVAPLTQLAKRTNVLWWHQSRYREFNEERKIDIDQPDANKYWEKLLHMNTFSDSIPFMDAWIWKTSMKNTGMWQWDSTVPFNLANLRECLQLKQSGVNDNVYKGKWWNCEDEHHSSYETNIVEIQMLLNLLCNPFQGSSEPYCCSKT